MAQNVKVELAKHISNSGPILEGKLSVALSHTPLDPVEYKAVKRWLFGRPVFGMALESAGCLSPWASPIERDDRREGGKDSR